MGLCSKGAAEDGRAPTEEVRVLEDGVSVRRGRPRTAALRQKSARVLEDGVSVRRGRHLQLPVWGILAFVQSCWDGNTV